MTEEKVMAVEGPGRLRRISATPAEMWGVRPWGRFTSATTLRQPRTSGRMWKRSEEVSLWGGLDHQKCPAIVPMGGVRLSGGSTSVTALRQPRTSERMWRRREEISRWGLDHQKCSTMRRNGSVDSLPPLSRSASPKAAAGESGKGAMARGSDMTLCSGASSEGAKPLRRVSGARTWQWPLERACRGLSGDLPFRGRDGD